MAFTCHFRIRRTAGILITVLISYLSYAFFAGVHIRSIWPAFKFSSTVQSVKLIPTTFTDVHLTADQCKAIFPELTKSVDDAVSRGPFKLARHSGDRIGNVQGKIMDSKLYLITINSDVSKDMAEHRIASLCQLHRAILTSPEPLPDIHFSLSIHDNPQANSWVYSQPTSPRPDKQDNYWIMPPFSLWSWNSPYIGVMDDVLARIQHVESSFDTFSEKTDRIVWRGTIAANPIDNPRLRNNLLSLTKDKAWADVVQLSYPQSKEGGAGLRIEDHCRYKYIAYTEGVTYSGRLPYHQGCASVLITPPLLHHTYSTSLIRPLFSSSLDLDPANFSTDTPKANPLAPNHSAPDESWPRSYSPDEANALFVAPDWSDLEAVIQWLRDHEQLAAGIANRQRSDVVRRGYLSQAAEACYWRALIRGWALVARSEIGGGEGQWTADEGIRFEEYLIKSHHDPRSVGQGW